MFRPITINSEYLDSEFVVHQNDAFKINTLTAAFFEDDVKKATSYTPEEWKAILQENKIGKCQKTRLAKSIKEGLPKN